MKKMLRKDKLDRLDKYFRILDEAGANYLAALRKKY
jgi:hypothetical protein